MGGSQTICGRGPNTPAMMLAAALAEQGIVVPIATMDAALEACRPQAWIDEHGALRAPDGFTFEFVDAPGLDGCGYQRKLARLIPLQSAIGT